MPALHSLTVRNCGLLKDVTLPFREGLTFLGGRNYDRNSTSGNAVGKSMLWSLLGGTIFQEQLWATKGVRNTNKSVIGEIDVSFSLGNDAYTLTQSNKGTKADYSLSKNGDPLNLHTMKNKVEAISELLPINHEHYISTVYIGGDATPILRGSSSERIEFFSNLWDFSSYQAKQDFFKKKRTALKEEVSRLSVYAEQASEMEVLDVSDLEESLKDLSKKKADILKAKSDLEEKYRQFKAFLKAAQSKPPIPKDECETMLSEAQEEQKAFSLYEERLKAWEAYSKRKASLESQLNGAIEFEDNIAELKESLAKAQKSYDFWNRHSSNYEKLKSVWKESAKEPQTDEQKETFAQRRQDAKDSVTVVKNDLSKLGNLHEGETCPTCLSPITSEHIDDLKAGLTAKLKKAENASLKYEAQSFYWAFKDCMSLTKEEAAEKVKQLKSEIGQAQNLKEEWEQDDRTRSLLDNLTPCEKPTSDHTDRSSDIRKYGQYLAAHSVYEENCHPFMEAAQLQEEIDKLEDELSGSESDVEAIVKDDKELSIKLRQAQDNNDRLTSLKEKADKLPQAKAELDMASWLYTQFSAKGIQQAYMQTVIGAYIENLNQYYAMILPDPPEFSFYLDGSVFDILAKRNGGTTDIRTLSKSEGKQFCAVSALALRSILPDKYVLDTVIFDEVEEGMSDYERGVYVNSFLPFAETVVPKIVVVTPRIEIKDMLEGFAYVLERKGNTTKLVEV